MIDESIIKILNNKESKLDWKGLLDYMESTGIDYQNKKLRGPWGIATFYCIFLDMDMICRYDDKLLYFIILHETSHYKRIIKKGGKDGVIKTLSEEDFDVFFNSVVEEEIVADRYASLLYYQFNKISWPREATQQLNLGYKQENYVPIAKLLYGVVKNKEENYIELLESFIV